MRRPGIFIQKRSSTGSEEDRGRAVIELKTVKRKGKKPVTMEMLDAAAEEAIKQIDDNAYMDALLEEGFGIIGRYGVSFYRKRCRVHYKDGYCENEENT